MVAALGRFISKSAERCLPFFNTVKGLKTVPWTKECQTAFEELKQYLSSPPLLAKPEPGEELLLYLSVNPTALAAVLVHEEHRQQKPVYYVSKVLYEAKIRYQRVKKLAYALPSTEPGIVQTPTVEIETTTEERTGDETETEIIPAPANQDPSTAEPIWEVHVDGSSNKGGCGAGLILTGPDNFTVDYALRFGFCASNNEAEYEALLAGMNLAAQTSAQRLKAYCDSQLVANQIQGVYEACDERMVKYLSQVCQLASKFKSFEVIRIPRAENTKADVLSKLAASGYTTLGSICMEFLQKSSIEGKAAGIMQVEHESCWMNDIIEYLRSGKLPEAKKDARKVTQRAARFSLDGENLYKRSYTLPYLKCLRPSNAAYALQETHEGICGEHLGGKALAIKVLLRGLYSPTLRQDALNLVRRFGIPRVLITDNGRQFDCRNFRKLCSDLKIEQRFTSVAHPQTNGQTEVTNRILLQGIKKRLDEKAGRWADELYHVLWAYRTTPRTSTGESPFNLSFGTEAVIPVDVGAPSPRVTNFNEKLNGEGLRANLDLLEEAREESQIRVAAYKQKVSTIMI
ncbi:uncharacterized protein LOC143889048 [Tasmannia lanceolata]|uniref:uncharacterized protein LOC143889048 n=1 Tax=Tasmannia lanceolata TaxID=3420 RepID=UPI004063703D